MNWEFYLSRKFLIFLLVLRRKLVFIRKLVIFRDFFFFEINNWYVNVFIWKILLIINIYMLGIVVNDFKY